MLFPPTYKKMSGLMVSSKVKICVTIIYFFILQVKVN